MLGMAKPKYTRVNVNLPDRELPLYVGARISAALKEIRMDMDLYKGVRLEQVLEAVYEQGMKDGRREIIEQLDSIKRASNFMPPGRPKKKRSHREAYIKN